MQAVSFNRAAYTPNASGLHQSACCGQPVGLQADAFRSHFGQDQTSPQAASPRFGKCITGCAGAAIGGIAGPIIGAVSGGPVGCGIGCLVGPSLGAILAMLITNVWFPA